MAAVATRSALAKRDLFTRGAEIVLAKPMALALSNENEKTRKSEKSLGKLAFVMWPRGHMTTLIKPC